MAAIGNMSVDELFFYGAFCLYSIAEIIRTTAFVMTFPILGTICHDLLILSALLLLMRLMLLRASDFQWLVTLGIFMLTALVAFRYGMEYPFWIFLFVISGKGIKIKRLARITLVLATVITVSAILACYAGFVDDSYRRPCAEKFYGFPPPQSFGGTYCRNLHILLVPSSF